MRWIKMAATSALLATTLAACSSSSGNGTGSTTSAAPPTSEATTSEPVATSPAASPSLVATSIDPCDLLTQQEASQLVGSPVTPGKEEDLGKGKACVYGGTPNVVTVNVVQVASAAQAQAGKDDLIAQAEQQFKGSVDVTKVPDFADGGAELQGSATVGTATLSASALYAVSGSIGFGFSVVALNHPAPDNAALLEVGNVMLGRL
jgi:Protein of unknown function (DUF3558)